MERTAKVEELLGLTLIRWSGGKGDDEIHITTLDGRKWRFSHEQDCCEHVCIDDVVGDVADLIGHPLRMAEMSTNTDNPPPHTESFTWTFYRFATIRGYVTVRWLGASNGYYSEEVDFHQVD